MVEGIDSAENVQTLAFVGTYWSIIGAGLGVDIALAWRLRRKRIDWPFMHERMQSRSGSTLDCILIVAAWLLMESMGAVMNRFVGGFPDQVAYAKWTLAYMLSTQLVIGLVALRLAGRGDLLNAGDRASRRIVLRSAGQAFIFYLAAMPIFFVAWQAWHKYLVMLDVNPTQQVVVEQFLHLDSLWMQGGFIVIAAVGAPLCEELCFRGVALPLIARRFGIWHSMAIVSLVFAVIHFHLPTLFPLFVISMAFCLGYVLTGNILVPIFMHAYFNGLSLISVFVGRLLME